MATGSDTAAGLGLNDHPKIGSLPNLRVICTRSASTSNLFAPDSIAAVFRSSKPDRIISEELHEFRKLGIRSIVDFRSKDEYLGSDGHRLLDKEYDLYKVLVPKQNYQSGECVRYEAFSIEAIDASSQGSEQATKKLDDPQPSKECENAPIPLPAKSEKRHFLINFFTMKYIFAVFNRLPMHLWCLGILYFMWDLIMRNKFKTFRKFFVTKAVNSSGIFGQYVDIVELSQPSICSALKLIADPNNLPVLINCAHGKDRTGIVSALILTCLGMSKEYVAEEYALSTEGLEPIKHLVYEDIVQRYHFKEEFCGAAADTMRELLTYIEDRYNSVEDYMVHIGFSVEEQNTLRQNLEAFEHKDAAGIQSGLKTPVGFKTPSRTPTGFRTPSGQRTPSPGRKTSQSRLNELPRLSEQTETHSDHTIRASFSSDF